MKTVKVGDTREVICIVSAGCYPKFEKGEFIDVTEDDTVLVRLEELMKKKDVKVHVATFSSPFVQMRNVGEAESGRYDSMMQWAHSFFREPTEEEVAQAGRSQTKRKPKLRCTSLFALFLFLAVTVIFAAAWCDLL